MDIPTTFISEHHRKLDLFKLKGSVKLCGAILIVDFADRRGKPASYLTTEKKIMK